MQPHAGPGKADCMQQCPDHLEFVQIFLIMVVMVMMVVGITCLLNHYKRSARFLTIRDGRPSSNIYNPRPPDHCSSYLQRDSLDRFQPTYPHFFVHSYIDLPPSIPLSDGEEPPPYLGISSLQLRDREQQLELNRESVRAPPNRTIFDSPLCDTVHCPPSMNPGISATTMQYTPPAYDEDTLQGYHSSMLPYHRQTLTETHTVHTPPLSSALPQINSSERQKSDNEEKLKAHCI